MRCVIWILFLVANSVQAEWTPIFVDGPKNGYHWYWDAEEGLYDRDKEIIQVPIMGSSDEASVWELIQFQCEVGSYRLLVTMYYDSPRAKGKPSLVQRIPKWELTKPKSPFGAMMPLLCESLKSADPDDGAKGNN